MVGLPKGAARFLSWGAAQAKGASIQEAMQQGTRFVVSVAVALLLSPPHAFAFTSKRKATGTPLTGTGGVTPKAIFNPLVVVKQGVSPDTTDVLSFVDDGQDSSASDFRDSNESLKVSFDVNVPGARIFIFTNNQHPLANPRFCGDPATGIDGGGLVGVSDCRATVPVVWAVLDTNTDYSFRPKVLPELGAENSVFITDRAHVRTFADVNGPIDNILTKFCDPAATNAVLPTNTLGDGLYPQYFGAGSVSLDLCSASDHVVFYPGGYIWPGDSIPQAQELSKNIAVVAFNLFNTKARVPDLSTADPADSLELTSPIYLPMGADFRRAFSMNYGSNTLDVNLVHQ